MEKPRIQWWWNGLLSDAIPNLFGSVIGVLLLWRKYSLKWQGNSSKFNQHDLDPLSSRVSYEFFFVFQWLSMWFTIGPHLNFNECGITTHACSWVSIKIDGSSMPWTFKWISTNIQSTIEWNLVSWWHCIYYLLGVELLEKSNDVMWIFSETSTGSDNGDVLR